MARTFSYQRQQRNRQQPSFRASWRNTRPERSQHGPFANLADLVREHRQAIARQTESAETIDKTEREI